MIIAALVITVYTLSAYYVASHVYEDYGRLWWPNGLGGSFFPWPYIPTGLAIQVLTPLSLADSQYFHYVIKSGMLVVLTLVLWFVVFLKVWRYSKQKKTSIDKESQ